MIDLHCHLLDETGCGPQSFAESLALCRRAFADGVRTIVATPRWDAGASAPPVPFADCERKLESLRREMGDALTLKLGFMLRLRSDLSQLVARYGSQLALGGGRYVLVSLPALDMLDRTEEVWDAVKGQGFAILVARPECSPALRRSPELLQRWIANGVKLQLDAASLVGAHGREVQSFAIDWARQYQGRIVVASNGCGGRVAHSSLFAAREALLKKHGVRCARLLTSETPAAIINVGRHDPHGDQTGAKPATLFKRLRGLRPHKTLLNES